MQVKILFLNEQETTRLLELLAETLASKNFDIANDACYFRNLIGRTEIKTIDESMVEKTKGAITKPGESQEQKEGTWAKVYKEINRKKKQDEETKADILKRTDERTPAFQTKKEEETQ